MGRRLITGAGLALLLLPACSSDGIGSSRTELTVFAAASLTAAFERIGMDFETANPGVTVTFAFGSSADLAAQIESEGTADVFASASERYMDEVAGTVGVDDRSDFAANELVIITPPANPAGITSLADLARSGVQVVLGAPGVPVGDYARQTLEVAGIRTKVLANVVSNEADDAALVTRITSGEADAAIVYRSDVTSENSSQMNAVEIPPRVNVAATYPIAVVAGSAHAALARAFVDYTTGAAGRATLAAFGFLPPPPG